MAEIKAESNIINPQLQQFINELPVEIPETAEETPVTPAPAPEPAPVIETPVVETIETPAPPVEATSPPAPAATPASPENVPSIDLKAIFGDDVTTPEQAKAKLESLKNPAPAPDVFANEYIKGLNEYIKQGGTKETYDTVVTLKVDEMDHQNALRTLMLLNNPELSAEDVDLAIANDYALSEDEDDQSKRIGKVRLVKDGNEAKEKLRALQSKHKVPEKAREVIDYQRIENERIERWKPEVASVVDSVKDLEIALDGKPIVKFSAISPQARASVLQDISNTIQHSGIPFDSENKKLIEGIVRERFMIHEYSNILRAVKEQTETETAQRIRLEIANPAPVPSGDAPPTPGKTAQEIQAARVAARL